MLDKLQQIEPSVQCVLMYVAFLGYRFPFCIPKELIFEGALQDSRGGVLNGLWKAPEEMIEGTSRDAQVTLATAGAFDLTISEGFVEQTGTLM